MNILTFVITLLSFQIAIGQHFVSSIDLDNTNQFARQILSNDGHYLLTIQSHCLDFNGSCGGIISVNIDGELIDTFLSEDFSSNLNALYQNNDVLYYSGEYKMGSAPALTVLKINSELNLTDSVKLMQENIDFYNYFATGSFKLNENHIVVGSSFCELDCSQVGHLFSLKDDKIDTSIIISFVEDGFTIPTHSMTNSNNEIVIYFKYRDFETNEDSIRIIKLDSNYNQVFEWCQKVIDNSSPRGCVTSADNMIITVSSDDYLGVKNIWSVGNSGKLIWKYNWPIPQGETNISRIEEANNGDLFVMGQLRNPIVLDDLRNVAFVMRLNSNGEELWRRYFKLEDQHNLLSTYIADLIELDNGDLLLTGQTRRIFYDPITGEDYPNQDILWARIGGDGCINDDCNEVYTITSTADQLIDPIDQIDIYPNPIQDNTLNIEVKDGDAQTGLIYGLEGQLIKEVDLTYGVNSITIETTSSILMVRILDEFGQLIHSEKVLKF